MAQVRLRAQYGGLRPDAEPAERRLRDLQADVSGDALRRPLPCERAWCVVSFAADATPGSVASTTTRACCERRRCIWRLRAAFPNPDAWSRPARPANQPRKSTQIRAQGQVNPGSGEAGGTTERPANPTGELRRGGPPRCPAVPSPGRGLHPYCETVKSGQVALDPAVERSITLNSRVGFASTSAGAW